MFRIPTPCPHHDKRKHSSHSELAKNLKILRFLRMTQRLLLSFIIITGATPPNGQTLGSAPTNSARDDSFCFSLLRHSPDYFFIISREMSFKYRLRYIFYAFSILILLPLPPLSGASTIKRLLIRFSFPEHG